MSPAFAPPAPAALLAPLPSAPPSSEDSVFSTDKLWKPRPAAIAAIADAAGDCSAWRDARIISASNFPVGVSGLRTISWVMGAKAMNSTRTT